MEAIIPLSTSVKLQMQSDGQTREYSPLLFPSVVLAEKRQDAEVGSETSLMQGVEELNLHP